MKKILTIACRELWAQFFSPLAYLLFAVVLALGGLIFLLLVEEFNFRSGRALMLGEEPVSLNTLVIEPYFRSLTGVFIFIIPVLTMRSFAEERSTGSFELLITAPIKSSEIVLGKALALFFLLFLIVLSSSLYPFILLVLSNPDPGPIFAGSLGLFLFAAGAGSLGLCISSVTEHQAAAALFSFGLLLFFYLSDGLFSQLSTVASESFKTFSPALRSESFYKGVLKSEDLIYFISAIVVGLLFCREAVNSQRR